MSGRWETLRREVPPTLALAWPVVLGQLGLMSMSLVDTAIVGRLGPGAVSAVGVGNAVYAVAFMFGLGLLMGLDRTVAVAHGAGREGELRRTLVQGVVLATAASVPLTLIVLAMGTQMHRLGVEPEVLADAQAYLNAVAWTLWPSLVFTAVRAALQGVGDTRTATVLTILANGVNIGANVWFIWGGAGLPAMGVPGSGLATGVARLFLMAGMLWHAWRVVGKLGPWTPDREVLVPLVRLGLPAGLNIVFEGGVFGLVTLLAARLGAESGAAHQIVLQVASFTFMVPLGVSSAGAVRVGQALGRGSVDDARRAGTTAVVVGVAFMAMSAAMLLAFGGRIAELFGQPPEVAALAQSLLALAGLFQVFDGAQVTLAGVLRGAGDTVSAMVTNLCAHWAVGLPLGAALCYGLGWGATGLWMGLASGLAVVAVTLGVVWRRRMAALSTGEATAEAA